MGVGQRVGVPQHMLAMRQHDVHGSNPPYPIQLRNPLG